MISCEVCKIFTKTVFKEPFGRLLLHKHLFRLLSHHDLSPFRKRYYTYFPAEYFLSLVCRLGVGVSSILQTLSQKPGAYFQPSRIFTMVVFCKNSWQLKALKYFCKKAPLQMFDQVIKKRLCKQPLKGVCNEKLKPEKNIFRATFVQ